MVLEVLLDILEMLLEVLELSWSPGNRSQGGTSVQSPRDVCIEVSSYTAPKGFDREGPRKEDARKEDPEALEHDLITRP